MSDIQQTVVCFWTCEQQTVCGAQAADGCVQLAALVLQAVAFVHADTRKQFWWDLHRPRTAIEDLSCVDRRLRANRSTYASSPDECDQRAGWFAHMM